MVINIGNDDAFNRHLLRCQDKMLLQTRPDPFSATTKKNGKNQSGNARLVSHGQTTYFSFDMGTEKNKGLAYYRYMFCAESRQILAIVDWPLIGVDRLQRCSAQMTYQGGFKVCSFVSFECL